MQEKTLWNRMWGESKFVPAGSTESVESVDADRIFSLEQRVKILEIRLNKLKGI